MKLEYQDASFSIDATTSFVNEAKYHDSNHVLTRAIMQLHPMRIESGYYIPTFKSECFYNSDG